MHTISLGGRNTPPSWALRQRHLFDLMDRAAPKFVERYSRPDGTFIWRDEWPGMDGSDDVRLKRSAMAPAKGPMKITGSTDAMLLTYRDYVRQNIFTQAGMTHSEFLRMDQVEMVS